MDPRATPQDRTRQAWAIFAVLGLGSWVFAARQVLDTSHAVVSGCTNALTDFCVFWGAASLAWSGQGAKVFDTDALAQASGNLDGSWFPWLHPPGALLLATPLGALPAGLAWGLFSALSVLAWIVALRRLAPERLPVWLLLSAPALLPALILGQMTLLWLAGAIAALALMRDGHAWRSGILIGLLTVKPTLGLLIPVALVALGAWRTIAAACATTLALHGGATLLYGTSYWIDMAEAYRIHGATVAAALPGLNKMASLPALLAGQATPLTTAMVAQTALTLGLAGIIGWVWRRPWSVDRKAAALLAAAGLATPYLWYYDTALMLGAALFLWRSERIGPWGLLPFWLGPAAMIWVGLLLPGPVPSSLYLWPALVAVLACAMWPGARSAPDGLPSRAH